MANEQLYDVIIFNRATRLIDAIVGTDMRSEDDPHSGFHTAEKRLMTAYERINDYYGAAMVPAGKFKQNDKYPTEGK